MLKLIFFLIAALPSVFGAIIIGSTTTSTIMCSTRQASTSTKSVPSSTKTKTVTLLPFLLTSKSTPVVTQTPSPVTSTSTVTSVSTVVVTNSAITDTFFTTSSITTTITVSTTNTYTETDTASATTTSTVNTNVPTSSGFLPIESTVNSPRSKLKKRSSGHPHSPLEARSQAASGQNCAAKHYPAAVSCVDYVEVRSKITVVLTAKTSTQTLPPSTKIVTSTTVVSSTSTVVPSNVPTTLSFSTTIPVTVTTTLQASSTTTTTSTYTVTSTQTSYDACATNNLLGPMYKGDTIDNIDFSESNSVDFSTSTTNSAYDCCVACITSGTCSGSGYDTDSGTCYQLTAQTCSNGQLFSGSFDYEADGDGFAFVVSNSNCGYLNGGN